MLKKRVDREDQSFCSGIEASSRTLKNNLLIQQRYGINTASRYIIALVAQGIEHWPPEPGAQVRILSRALLFCDCLPLSRVIK